MDKPLTLEQMIVKLRKKLKCPNNKQISLNKHKELIIFRKTQKKKLKSKKQLKNISNNVIQLFYGDPKNFFENHVTLLKNTSYYDESNNSIFAHYFNILYNIYLKNNNSNSEIYLSKFNSFFKEHGKYLTIQDLALETPLHKIAKIRNKKFFFTYYNKLKEINIINDEILLIKNIDGKSCFDLIVKEVEIKRTKLIKNDFNVYNNFFKTNEKLIEKLPMK